jgi:sulfofructosephosphate aldolase
MYRPAELYKRIATRSGGFAMVAMDQRESLRTMMEEHAGEAVQDNALTAFKLAVVSALSPHASALLIDDQFGLRPMLDAGALHTACGLIVAADALTQVPGEPVADTSIDESIDPADMKALGASALKLLVICQADGDPHARRDLVKRFVDRCHAGGLLALVEPVVRPPAAGTTGWERDQAILHAAIELGGLGMDVYKAEVPMHGRGDPAEIERRCRKMTEVLPCPWVVLSQGVTVEDFSGAVEAACRGGASGFLAGRAVWSDTLSAPDPATRVSEVSVPRLQHLRETVERLARPWTEVVGG